jgi:Uma2 family endonuclease
MEPLENGERLTAPEFLRRYEAMPEVKKAELIEGIVYMPSPVRFDAHAVPNTLIQTWLRTYSAKTPGTQVGGNGTVRLDIKNVPQPDVVLRITEEYGGRSRLDEKGYLVGPPELVVEIAASSTSIDLHDKLRAYRCNGVKEYLVWRTLDDAVDWFVLADGDSQRQSPERKRHLRGGPGHPQRGTQTTKAPCFRGEAERRPLDGPEVMGRKPRSCPRDA